MNIVILTAKAALAVMLLVAGAAKVADLASFAAAVRLLTPFRAPRRLLRAAGLGIAIAELGLGGASLSSPATGWLNPAVFAFTCGFVVVSTIGYAFHRGRSCRCFGALSNRRFDAFGISRSVGIAAAAALAMQPAPLSAVTVSGPSRVLLLLSGAVISIAAFSAARALGLARSLEPEVS